MPGTEGRRALRLGRSAKGPAAFLSSRVAQGERPVHRAQAAQLTSFDG